jgi:hypothetical protein
MNNSASLENWHFHCSSLVRKKKNGPFLSGVGKMDGPLSLFEGADPPPHHPLRYTLPPPQEDALEAVQ